MASTLLFENKTINPARSSWGGGGQGSLYHTVGVYSPTYEASDIPDAFRATQTNSVDCWSSDTPITGTISLSGSMSFWPYSVYYDGRSVPTYTFRNTLQLALVVNDTGDPIPFYTFTSDQLNANNQAGNIGRQVTENWTGTASVENATSIKLAILCYLSGEANTWTNAEASGTISVAVFEPARTELPIYIRTGDTIIQAEKVYKRVGNEIKECDVYLRVGNEIKLLK